MEIVLDSYGANLSVSNKNFVVCSTDCVQNIPVYGISSIYVWKSTRISSDAILLALSNDIDIIFMDNFGNVKGRVWNCKFGSIASIRRGQLIFGHTRRGVTWMKETIQRKITNQADFLTSLEDEFQDNPKRNKLKHVLKYMKQLNEKVNALSATSVQNISDQLRGIEGLASKTYFQTLACVLPTTLHFKRRQQRPCNDIVNAMLNYAYAILYNKVETALIKSGLDPAIGVLHCDNYNKPVFTYDVIEPYRLWADQVVFHLVISGNVSPDMGEFDDEYGTMLLNQELRRELSMRLISFLEDTAGGKSPLFQMKLDTQRLAQEMKMLAKNEK